MKKTPFSLTFDQFIYISALQRKIRQKIKNPPQTVPSFLFLIRFQMVDIEIEKKIVCCTAESRYYKNMR